MTPQFSMLLLLALACAPVLCAADSTKVAEFISGAEVKAGRENKGIALLAVRWDRRWKCAGYENAQLRVIAFDKVPSEKSIEAAADLTFDDAPPVTTKPAFDNYAVLLDPGEYGLSRLEIKVARSVSDVGFFKATRDRLIKDGRSLGGTFTVGAGEVVYLGHFYLDCATAQPTLWRYYPDGRADFLDYLSSLKKAYPLLEANKVVFRLFKTTEFGQDYDLPN